MREARRPAERGECGLRAVGESRNRRTCGRKNPMLEFEITRYRDRPARAGGVRSDREKSDVDTELRRAQAEPKGRRMKVELEAAAASLRAGHGVWRSGAGATSELRVRTGRTRTCLFGSCVFAARRSVSQLPAPSRRGARSRNAATCDDPTTLIRHTGVHTGADSDTTCTVTHARAKNMKQCTHQLKPFYTRPP